MLGAIPARRGATISNLKQLIRKQKRAGFDARIVTESKLKMILRRVLPAKARSLIKKRIRRKKKR